MSFIGRRSVRPPSVPEDIACQYDATVGRLLAINIPADSKPKLRLSDLAREVWYAYSKELEPRLGDSGDLSHIRDWAGKLAGTVARLAGILHCAEVRDEPWSVAIGDETMRRATALGDYLIGHAKAAFVEMGADPEVERAKRVLRWIRENNIQRFSRRTCHQVLRGSEWFRKIDDLKPALELLERHEYIAQLQGERNRPGRPSTGYRVNPIVHRGAEQNPQNPRNPRSASDAASTTPPTATTE